VGGATVGIAIALLAGVAPLAWTLTAIGLLMVSLMVSAGLDSCAELLNHPTAHPLRPSSPVRGTEQKTCGGEYDGE